MRNCYTRWLCCHSEWLQWAGTSWNSITGNAKSCALGVITPGTSTHCSRVSVAGWKAAWQRSTQDPAGQKAEQKASSVFLWPRQTTASWTAQRRVLPVGWKRWSFPSTQHWRDTPQVLSSLLDSPEILREQVWWETTQVIKDCSIWPVWRARELGPFSLEKKKLQSDFTIFGGGW